MIYRANPVEVQAHIIIGVCPIASDGSIHVITEDGTSRIASRHMIARYIPSSGDYWVIQRDGYEYVNPKDVFERKYSPLP